MPQVQFLLGAKQPVGALLWATEQAVSLEHAVGQCVVDMVRVVVVGNLDARLGQPAKIGPARVSQPGLTVPEPPLDPPPRGVRVAEPERHDEDLLQRRRVPAGTLGSTPYRSEEHTS